MDETEFFAHSRVEYENELKQSDRIFGRLPLLVSANVVVGGLLGYLTTTDYLGTQGAVALSYYLMASLAVVFLAASVAGLFAAIGPRTYCRIEAAAAWARWRMQYREQLIEVGYDDATTEQVVARSLRDSMGQQMRELTVRNRAVNRRRFWCLNMAMWCSMITLACIAIEGFLRVWLSL